MSRTRLSTLVTSLVFAGSIVSAAPVFGQIAGPTTPAQPANPADRMSPRDLSKVKSEFLRVRDQMDKVQREFDRAARGNLPAVRDAALKDWQRSLDGLEPYVATLSADVPDEKALIDQYHNWRDLYFQAADPALAGEFFLQISKYWAQVTAGTDGWEQENAAPTFDAFAKAPLNDPLVQSLGMPKTANFVTASNTYLQTVAARPDYERFRSFENVKQDQMQVEAARDRAYAKLTKAADTVIGQASITKLDQAGRDRMDAFVEQRLPILLAGSSSEAGLQLRGRQAVYGFDKTSLGEEAATKSLNEKLTTTAESEWPKVLAAYVAQPMAPVGAGRGQIVRIRDAKNLKGKEFGTNDYDFAGYIDGAPVVGTYAPGVKAHVDQVLGLTGAKSLPDGALYDLVGVVRGTAQVANIKQRPGATTAPASADDATATTAPAVTDCTVIDIFALHAGPVAVGTKIEPVDTK